MLRSRAVADSPAVAAVPIFLSVTETTFALVALAVTTKARKFHSPFWFDDLLVVLGGADFLAAIVKQIEEYLHRRIAGDQRHWVNVPTACVSDVPFVFSILIGLTRKAGLRDGIVGFRKMHSLAQTGGGLGR